MTSDQEFPIVHSIADDALGNTSYLVALDERTAIVVDPRRDIDDHIALAGQLGLRVAAVFETHLHADFVSGAREIARATDAEIYAAAGARLEFTHTPFQPRSRIQLGEALVEVIATPGHTPEHVSYLLTMNVSAILFSGGSLIVGGAARTDLTGPDRTRELARAQFQSVQRLAVLPGDTVLYPTHGAGSFCSTGAARSAASTIAAERDSNPLLAIGDEDEFVRQLVNGFGTYPRYFSRLRELNRRGAPLLRELSPIRELEAADACRAVEDGAWLIDGRDVEMWARAHPTGAVSIELRDAFASWLGWVVPFGEAVVLVLEPEQIAEASRLAHRIGYDRIDGWFGLGSWLDAGFPISSLEFVDPQGAVERQSNGATFLDVRQDSEFVAGHIPGATHLQLGDIIGGKTPDAAEVITYCGHGERSATAASLLARRGVAVANLAEGISAWRRGGYPFGT
jgi:hydroxyacylglutathione hydrolase